MISGLGVEDLTTATVRGRHFGGPIAEGSPQATNWPPPRSSTGWATGMNSRGRPARLLAARHTRRGALARHRAQASPRRRDSPDPPSSGPDADLADRHASVHGEHVAGDEAAARPEQEQDRLVKLTRMPAAPERVLGSEPVGETVRVLAEFLVHLAGRKACRPC